MELMMEKIPSGFVTHLKAECHPDNESIWVLDDTPLVYNSQLLNAQVVITENYATCPFYTDLASVPRVPIIYELWGNRAHREAVLHDYLFRINSVPVVSWMTANRVFLEAMLSTGKP